MTGLADPAVYIDGVLRKDRRWLARAITLIESVRSDHQAMARKVVDGLLPHAGGSIRLGVTGVPGVGKSTFIECLGSALAAGSHRVAVLAVDPSSRKSGGSILGDKTRMTGLSAEKNAFIRPSPAGRTLGGVAARTRETMILCEAAGFDVVIVETVGVGQSETVVASMVDFFLFLVLAGAGDELQGIKKGIMELADAIAVNKADGDNLSAAKKAKTDYENALHYLMPASALWTPAVHTVSSLETEGVLAIWADVLRHHEILTRAGALEEKRKQQSLAWFDEMLEQEAIRRFHADALVRDRLPEITRAVKAGEISPATAFQKLFE